MKVVGGEADGDVTAGRVVEDGGWVVLAVGALQIWLEGRSGRGEREGGASSVGGDVDKEEGWRRVGWFA